MSKQQNLPFIGLIKAVVFAVKQFRLYSSNHPITRQALDTLEVEIDKFFSTSAKINLGSIRKLLVVNGEILGEKETTAHELAKEFDRLGVEGITLEKGVDLSEMSVFLGLMAMPGKVLEQKGGFRKVYEENPLPHIKLAAGRYELVGEGEAVQSSGNVAPEENVSTPSSGEPAEGTGGQGGGDSKMLSGIADIIQRLREENPAAGTVLDSEKIVVQIEKNPQEVAQVTLENAPQNPPAIESVIRKLVRYLTEGLVAYLAETGKDITKAMDNLAKEFEKAVAKVLEGKDYEELKKKIPVIFEEAEDDLRVKMMVKVQREHPGDMKLIQKMADKLFKDEDTRQRLSRSLNEELTGAGLSAEQCNAIFNKIEEKAAKKKSRVTVDAEELEELRRKAGLYDQGGGGGDDKALRKKLEKVEKEKKQIADEKERVDTVIRNLAEGLLVVDKNGKVVLMNPAAEKMLGVKQADKAGKPLTDGLQEGQMVSMASGNLKDTEDHVEKKVEVVSLNDQTKRVLQASTAVIENEDGHTVGMVSVLSDITRQKELDELKDKFVANVSHELRTPLVAIEKSLALILEKELGDINPEQRKFLDIAFRNIGRLSRLINDLLDVSKLESGKMILKPEHVSLKEVTQQVFSTLQTWGKDKKISFKTDFSDEKLILECDPDRMTQVITNLVGNAVKFTPEGGSITVDAKGGIQDPSAGGECIEIGVRDTGIGIAPQDLGRIFQKFEQVSLAQPQGVSSTGLGLTIVKEIVELHNGRIWVESEVGKGSRFVFRIPLKSKIRSEKPQEEN